MLAPLGRALVGYHHRTIHVPRVRRLIRALGREIRTAESVLDVGCGDGSIAQGVAAVVGASRVCGVDVKLRPEVLIDARAYDGRGLPYDDQSFEVVLLSDVLHHAEAPEQVLREGLRVARRAVVVKDHLAFGPLSRLVLLAMDRVGNAGPEVAVPGRYFELSEWFELVRAAGGRIANLRWPVRIHDLPWRLVTRSELQFVARVEPVGRSGDGRGGQEDDHGR